MCVLVLVASSAYSQQSSYYNQPQQLQQTPITFNNNQPRFSLPVALKSSPNDQFIAPQPGFQLPVAFAPSGTQQSVQTIGSIQQQIASNLFKHRVLGTNVPKWDSKDIDFLTLCLCPLTEIVKITCSHYYYIKPCPKSLGLLQFWGL